MTTFDKLWNNFPDETKIKKLCINKQIDSQKPFENYCAILLSDSFNKSGVDLNSYKGSKCWSHIGKKHALLAADFANWLSNSPPPSFGKKKRYSQVLSRNY